MTLKEKIATEYTAAFKNRETAKKNLLGVLRGEITTIEKNTGQTDLSDAEITKLLLKYKKNIVDTRILKDSADLALEQSVIESFLPAEMPLDTISAHVQEILAGMPTTLPVNARVGKTMGEFNKRFPGMADPKVVMSAINEAMGL
jgi:uncharacterized protein YqeY